MNAWLEARSSQALMPDAVTNNSMGKEVLSRHRSDVLKYANDTTSHFHQLCQMMLQ